MLVFHSNYSCILLHFRDSELLARNSEFRTPPVENIASIAVSFRRTPTYLAEIQLMNKFVANF